MTNPNASFRIFFYSISCCLLFLAATQQTALAEDRGAFALWTEVDVKSEAPGTGELKPVGDAQAMAEGERIVTGEGGECGVGFEGALEDSVLKVMPGSTARLTNLGDDARVDVEDGSVFVKLKGLPAKSRFEVSTPTAVAVARGTAWLQSKDAVEVFDGSVHVDSSSGQTQDLEKDEALDITPAGALSAKRAVLPSGRQAWNIFQEGISKNVLRASEIQEIREAIDAKRASATCGPAGPFAWERPVAVGDIVRVSDINELKTALSQAPFKQGEAYVRDFLDPIPVLSPGDHIQVSHLNRLRKAVENASVETCEKAAP